MMMMMMMMMMMITVTANSIETIMARFAVLITYLS